MSNKGKVPAIAYLRKSSAANVGADKDSDRRQRESIASFAKRAGYELVGEFNDAAVSRPITSRRAQALPRCSRASQAMAAALSSLKR